MRSLLLGLLAVAAAAADIPIDSQSSKSIVVLILSNGETRYDERMAEETKRHVEREMEGEKAAVVISHRAFGSEGRWGHHAVWPLIPRIASRFPSLRWLVVMETESRMSGERLRRRLRHEDEKGEEEGIFIGRALVDEQPVITHHFYGFDNPNGDIFQYPDFAAGVVLSGGLVRRLAEGLGRKRGVHFTIDAKHEFARLVKDLTGVLLTSEMDNFCQSAGHSNCIFWFEQRTGTKRGCNERREVDRSSLMVGVKTHSGFHRTRVVVTKRTWGKNVRNIHYYSDVEDPYIPSTSLGIPNTVRGHCRKTMEILKDALNREEIRSSRWIFIADDDTLVALSRLERWLRCYDEGEKMIIGERYGYGYEVSGEGGYDYPTGGAGMVFSLPAARLLVEECECPSIDSPDDMILGMCARRLSIPIVHSPAMHQVARRALAVSRRDHRLLNLPSKTQESASTSADSMEIGEDVEEVAGDVPSGDADKRKSPSSDSAESEEVREGRKGVPNADEHQELVTKTSPSNKFDPLLLKPDIVVNEATSILLSPPISLGPSSISPTCQNTSPSPVADSDHPGALPSTLPSSLPSKAPLSKANSMFFPSHSHGNPSSDLHHHSSLHEVLSPVHSDKEDEMLPSTDSSHSPSLPTLVQDRYKRVLRKGSLRVPLIEEDRDENGLYVCPVCRCVKFETDDIKWNRGIQKNNVTGHMRKHSTREKRIARLMLTREDLGEDE